jgi:hypothetical protein
MKNSFKFLIALILGLGIGGFAQADNFSEITNSLQVAPTDQPSAYGLEFAKATKKIKATDEEKVSDVSSTVFDNSQSFLQIYSGLDFSFLEDVVNGSNGWVSGIKAEGGTASGGGNNFGVQAGALFGIHLDPVNSLALDLGSVFTFGNNWTGANGGTSDTENMGPMLYSASLDYILDIVKAPGARTYLTAGAGWYHAAVYESITGTNPTTVISQGTWTGDTLGGTLGIGEEVDLGGSLGLDISVKGRYASFSKVSSTSARAFDGTGPSSLAILNTAGVNVIVPVTDATIASSGGLARDAVIDYSGIDAKVALNLYF